MNYEKKYKEALERAKSFCKRWDGLKIDSSSRVIQEVKEFFPELDNIEDEIMREDLYKCLRCYVPNDRAEEFIAWLEKHKEKEGEQKSSNIPSRETIHAIWELGNNWKDLTKGVCSTEHGTQLKYIQNHWQESSFYDKIMKGGEE